MDTAPNRASSLLDTLTAIRQARLDALSDGQVGKVVRRVVDHDAVAPKLDVARFNSAI